MRGRRGKTRGEEEERGENGEGGVKRKVRTGEGGEEAVLRILTLSFPP